MAAVLAWAQLDLRQRWRSLVVVALLVALGSGTVMAAVAGARRGDSAVDRLAAQTLPADAWVTPNDPDWDWAPFRELPYVEALTERVISEAIGFEDESIPPGSVAYPVVDTEYGTTIDRPVVLEGRWYDATRWDEAVVTPGFVSRYGVAPGDTVRMVLGGPEQAFSDPMPSDQLTGPHISVRVVGVVRSFALVDEPGRTGLLQNSPALVERYPDNILGLPDAPAIYQSPVNAMVRLENGTADMNRFQRDLHRLEPRARDVAVLELDERYAAAERSTDFEATFLYAFGAAALLAALFLVGQAVARHVFQQSEELATAAALGQTPRESVLGAAAGPLLAAVVGVTVGCAGAVVASRWFPLGRAASYEPDPGVDADPLVLVVGAPAVVLAVGLVAAVTAWSAIRVRKRPAGASRRVLATLANRVPAPVALGIRFAAERGSGAARVPVAPALSGAAAGVLGIVAVVVMNAGIDDALGDPARFGQTHDAVTVTGIQGEDYVEPDVFRRMLLDLDVVAEVTQSRQAAATSGDVSLALFEYPRDAALDTVVTDGRMPEAEDEVLLGPSRLDLLDAEVGDTILATGSTGTHRLRIVGEGLLPTGPVSRYGDGGWVTSNGFDRLFRTFEWRDWLVLLDDRSGDAATVLQDAFVAANPDLTPPDGPSFVGPDIVREQAALRDVRALPLAFGAFLGVLAAGVVGHALVLAVRRRSGELAVSRAVGMTPLQAAAVVVVQACVVAAFGILLGTPLGLALGRTAWRSVAEFTPVEFVAPFPVTGLLLTGLGALATALVLTALPAARAARTSVASILRAE